MKGKNSLIWLGIFFMSGLAAQLLSSWISTLFIATIDMTEQEITILIAPIFEELFKAIPIFIFAFVFKPERVRLISAAFSVGVGFALLDSILFIIHYNTIDPLLLIFEVISAAALHIVCAVILGYSIISNRLILLPGSLGLLCAACAFHSMYNLFVSAPRGEMWQMIGYILPIIAVAVLVIFDKQLMGWNSP